MKYLQKIGAFAALYLAAAYLIGMGLFLVVLNYPSITDPAQKVALLVEKQMVIFSTNLLMYVFFGVFLVVLSLTLYDRLKSSVPAIMQVATVIGIIWAGSLIASGMVANAGIAPVVALYAKDRQCDNAQVVKEADAPRGRRDGHNGADLQHCQQQ